MKIFVLLFIFLSYNVFALEKVEVDVPKITCQMCVNSITESLKSSRKVKDIKVDLDQKKASFMILEGKKLSDSQIKKLIKKAGYKAKSVKRKEI